MKPKLQKAYMDTAKIFAELNNLFRLIVLPHQKQSTPAE